MKKMRFIHCMLLIVLLGITAAGTMLILGAVPEEMLEFENPVQMLRPEAATEISTEVPTEVPTEAPTEAPTEPPTEAPTEAPTEPQPERFVLTFVGDCTLGCNYKNVNYASAFPKTVGDDYGYPFRNVLNYFQEDDYSFANLEGVLGDKGTRVVKKYSFRGTGEYTKILTENGVDVVTLANNHSFDYGQEGFDETKRLLEEAGVPYAEHMTSTTVTTESGLTIGIFAVDFTRGADREAIYDGIRTLKETGVELLVCAFHWGKENTFRTTDIQKEVGKGAIDAGANIVWGHHPHVLQPIEAYNDGMIYYSLGNFAFGGNGSPKDLNTALLQQEVIREPDGTVHLGELTIVPCSVTSEGRYNNFQPTPYEPGSDQYKKVMSKLDGSYEGANLPIG